MTHAHTPREAAAAAPNDDGPTVQGIGLRELPAGAASGPRLLDGNLALISSVKVRVDVSVGSGELTIGELFGLQRGSVIPLDSPLDAPVAVRLDGKTIAYGTLVVVDDNFGIRIAEIGPAKAATMP